MVALVALIRTGSNHADKPEDEQNHNDRSERNGQHMGLLLKPCFHRVCVGLARRGRRRAKGPLYGWIKRGSDSYVDSDIPKLYQGVIRLRYSASVTWSTKTLVWENFQSILVAEGKFRLQVIAGSERETAVTKILPLPV